MNFDSPIIMARDDIYRRNIDLVFNCNNNPEDFNAGYFWSLYIDDQNNGKGLVFYTFSDMVSPTSESYDVLKFYITFIFVIGKFIRSFIAEEAQRVIYTEMPRPQKLLNLCEGIKVARLKKDLVREEQLYYVLIDLMRSPDMLKMITKPSLKNVRNEEDKSNKQQRDLFY